MRSRGWEDKEMGRSFGRGTGKETNPVIINKEFTMSGTGWCPGLDYEGNPEGCFIGFPEEWMPLSTSNPDPRCKPSKKNHANRNHSEGWTMAQKEAESPLWTTILRAGWGCGLPKEKGELCLQVHVALGLLNGGGVRPNWPEMFRSRKDPPPPHQGPVSGVRNIFLWSPSIQHIQESRMHSQELRVRFQSRDSQPKPSRTVLPPSISQRNKEWNDT